CSSLMIYSTRRLVASHVLSSVQSYGDHRDLHSFPTRRSSDLGAAELPGTVRPPAWERLAIARTRRLRRTRPRRQGVGTGEGVALDRKSTRLNSSHVKISYAVFCLKKKNTNTI